MAWHVTIVTDCRECFNQSDASDEVFRFDRCSHGKSPRANIDVFMEYTELPLSPQPTQ